MKINITETLSRLLAQEDTDQDKKITIEDQGPKEFEVLDAHGNKAELIQGTYALSNLLQELVIAQQAGLSLWEWDKSKINESPPQRISRMIREYYWDGLTRSLDEKGIPQLIADTKNADLHTDTLRIYIPHQDTQAQAYFKHLTHNYPIQVVVLPKQITPEYVMSLNTQPGILALKLKENQGATQGVPFVVPGGRFNEMYGWDSYFQNIGLLLDGKTTLAKSVVDNFQYEIEHYGKILNANRSYYLTRTQPPFYTSMIQEVYEQTKDVDWLKSHFTTAIKEYQTVWMQHGKRLASNGLNRYLAEGIGMPPEAEEGHFDKILSQHAQAHDMPLSDFTHQYQNRKLNVPELDDYFVHDRSVRESGHDTTYRLEGICADLNPVELNCMLYQYEMHFAHWIQNELGGTFAEFTAEDWLQKAQARKELIQQYMWNEEDGVFYDYNIQSASAHQFLSATCFFPLWAGIATEQQAKRMIENHLPKLTEKGGVAGCTQQTLKERHITNYDRQWDYPNGWAPHQIILWKGLIRYGFNNLAQDLIFRWLCMITQNAVNYNGTIPEKYNVALATHKVFAEYGNVGTDFEYITQEGFGWMNASYQYGMSLLSEGNLKKLTKLVNVT